ncbi:MAG: hypothetical protein KAI96_05400, partial [Thermodesulfovibrionia bacterium]|nr:hypothetical protein [Thermodesulfovibrionia bacterium]
LYSMSRRRVVDWNLGASRSLGIYLQEDGLRRNEQELYELLYDFLKNSPVILKKRYYTCH